MVIIHSIKDRNFIYFPGLVISWKRKNSFNSPKALRKLSIPQNFHTRKLSEISVYCAAIVDIVSGAIYLFKVNHKGVRKKFLD